jgi:hypothetical protein
LQNYYTTQGLLLPSYHKTYWLGLMASGGNWLWNDKAIPGEDDSTASLISSHQHNPPATR